MTAKLLPRRLPRPSRGLHQAVALTRPSPAPRPPPARSQIDGLLAEYARLGNTRDFEQAISHARFEQPTAHQRDLHVKAHILSASSCSALSPAIQHFPTSALAVLHQYEASGNFAPIKSYTRVISALFNVETCASSDPNLGRAAAQAQAWDLFAHMRYTAHAVPDAHLYALMIRACGSRERLEPERALDLWTEMQENAVEPTRGAYEAVIKVCGRAGSEWLGEGMRLAREMSDRYSMTGTSAKGLWCALLEGCKRVGDLKKARWILAEAVRGSGDGADTMLDAELMTHVFHTYASYKPPFVRESTRVVDDGVLESEERRPAKEPPPNEGIPSFSRLPPQTPSDVIAETRVLFDNIIQDGNVPSFPEHSLLKGRFARVELTPVLLNAYLSVFYRHATIEASREEFNHLFGRGESSGMQVMRPDEYTYINALERCAIAHVQDRHVAARWAEDVWRRWEAAEATGVGEGKGNVGWFARLIEKAHAAMRRVLILSGDVDAALALLRSFVARYPPSAVLAPMQSTTTDVKSPAKSTAVRLFAKPPILSTRTVLTNPASTVELSTARPLVRLTSAVLLRDDRVPPIVTFGDVDLLHARLVEHGRVKDVGYIKWVCVSYASALKKRRGAVLEAVPARGWETGVKSPDLESHGEMN